MHVLITGHTGFKGSWLTILLKELGYQVSGVSLDPPVKSLFNTAGVLGYVTYDYRIDIRDFNLLKSAVNRIKPDVVIHLAAQSLVENSYKNPVRTYETNMNGTMNILRSILEIDSVKAVLIITTDKVYKNNGFINPYKESDPLGGNDPYSSSKTMADILTQAWVKSFNFPPTSIVRAGNVIGGGDFTNSRLIPSIINTVQAGGVPFLRNPNFVRPWQHVLDCLNGYILLFEKMIENGISGEWNFGSEPTVIKKVSEVCDEVLKCLNSRSTWNTSETQAFHEEKFLLLDSTKARAELGWHDKLSFEEVISWTTEWYVSVNNSKNASDATLSNIKKYLNLL